MCISWTQEDEFLLVWNAGNIAPLSSIPENSGETDSNGKSSFGFLFSSLVLVFTVVFSISKKEK